MGRNYYRRKPGEYGNYVLPALEEASPGGIEERSTYVFRGSKGACQKLGRPARIPPLTQAWDKPRCVALGAGTSFAFYRSMKKLRTSSGNILPDTRFLGSLAEKRWYIVANRSEAVFYRERKDHLLQFVKRLSNPLGRKTEKELVSDRPGRGFSSSANGSIRHALDRRSNHHEKSARDFARQIAKFLNSAQQDALFSELVLVSEPHFLGLLREELSPATRDMICHEINREYKTGSDQDVSAFIHHAIGRRENAREEIARIKSGMIT